MTERSAVATFAAIIAAAIALPVWSSVLRNLWPQPIAQAHRKDQWKLGLNRAVCAGPLALVDAQHKIADPGLWR